MVQMTLDNPAPSTWQEITHRKEELQEIMKLMIHLDETTGRAAEAAYSSGHHLRKSAAAFSPAADLSVFAKRLGRRIYFVVVSFMTDSDACVVSWIHEDAIPDERLAWKDNADHSVHRVVCLTDLLVDAIPQSSTLLEALPDAVRHVMDHAPADHLDPSLRRSRV